MGVANKRMSPGARKRIRTLMLIAWISAFHYLLLFDVWADFQIVEPSPKLKLFISGKINETDAKALQELSPELERNWFTVYLDSLGGDVLAAMRIGRMIRKYEGETYIGRPPNYDEAKCYSSCALIFIAGVLRLSSGYLGLHRPYLSSPPQSREAVEKQVPQLLSSIKQYITEMGITNSSTNRW